MKKVLAVSLMVLMVVCMSITVFAAGEFVQSPSNNGAPTLEESNCGKEGCEGTIIITAFRDRFDLSPDERQRMEDAYRDIANSENLTELCPELSKVAEDKGIPETNLSVSDLFNISSEDCDGHGKADLVLSSDTFANFVGLMYLTDDGWKYLDGAEVKVVNGEYHLYFTAAEFTTYAVVVNSAVITDKNPHTGDTNSVYFFAVLMAVSAFAVVALVKKGKKQTV